MSEEQKSATKGTPLTWEPIRDIIIIRPLDDTEDAGGGARLLPGGVVVPGEALPRRIRGVVVKAGPDCEIFGRGDLVIYQDRDGVTVEIGDREYLAIYETRAILRIPRGEWTPEDAQPGKGAAKDQPPQMLAE